MTQSIEKLQKKLDKAPNSTIFSQLAEEHRKEGNFDDALRILKDGLTRHPNYWSARVTLGRVYHQMGKAELAREELEKVIQSVPDNLLANKLLGDIYMFMDQQAEALKRYRIVQMLNPSDQDVAANIKRLESEIKKPAPAPEPIPQPEPTAVLIPQPESLAEPLTPSVERTDPIIVEDEESYAPTVMIRIPDFLEKTEVPVKTTEAIVEQEEVTVKNEEESAAPEKEPVLPSVEELESVEEIELASNTLIMEQPEKLEEEKGPSEAQQPEQMDHSSELSSLASLLLEGDSKPVEEHQFDELESELIQDHKVEPVDELVSDAQQDRTQPIDEGEESEIEDAEELTTETLAELYLNQGLVDKAAKVYQRLLLNDPGNEGILQRLSELRPNDDSQAAEPVYQEEVLVEVPSEQRDRTEATVIEETARRAEQRRRKITTLENWLTTIRRERD